MENIWAIVCSKVIIDQRTKMVTIIEAVDALDLGGELPPFDGKKPINIGLASINVITYWYRSDVEKPETKHKVRYLIVGPDEGELGHHEIEINLQDSVSQYSIVGVPSLPYVGIGLYNFYIEKMEQGENQWTRTARLPLLVRANPKND